MINQNKNSYIDIAEVNRQANDPLALIQSCEENYHSQLEAMADMVLDGGGRYRLLLLAGPSSSGKTTTAHKLAACFAHRGVEAPVVSLDDFFMGLAFYPKLPDGSPNMEALEALDLPLLDSTLLELVRTGRARFPTFDFANSQRGAKWHDIALPTDGLLILEGLHALNPRIVAALEPGSAFRGYVSTRTKYMDGEREVLSPKDNRLLRRMVRDHNFRGKQPIKTIYEWPDVLAGELKYINPFRDDAQFKIDSSHDYEGCVFHHYILPMVDALRADPLGSERVMQIVDILETFDDIRLDYIPDDSLLREFIGQ